MLRRIIISLLMIYHNGGTKAYTEADTGWTLTIWATLVRRSKGFSVVVRALWLRMI